MKHIFIVNPVAGLGNAKELFNTKILSYMKKREIDYRIHITTGVGDAKNAVEHFYKKRQDNNEILRFYACGGDGTLNEVVNGAVGKENVQIACMPAGSGNDFIRNFGDEDIFKDIKAQLNANVKKVDCILCTLDDKQEKYGINLINIGADCIATRYKQSVKAKFLKGATAYIYGAVRAFIELASIPVSICIDEKESLQEDITLLAIGNGSTYGGGFKPTPNAIVDDGILDICMVKHINRIQFLNLVGAYKKGEHINVKSGKDVISYKLAKKLELKSKDEIDITIDGEMLRAKKLQAQVVPNAISFVVPKK